MRFLGVALVTTILGACADAGRASPPGTTSVVTVTPSSSATFAATASATSSALPPAIVSPPPALDPDEERLRRATLKTLSRRLGPGVRAGVFDGTLITPEGEVLVVVEPSLITAPTALRRPLAFHRLAVALGMHVVPPATLRGASLEELGASLTEPDAREILKSFRAQNDGLVDVLFTALSAPSTGATWTDPRGTPFDPAEGAPTNRWDTWASSPTEVPSEDAHLLRDYVEMQVLDYLAGNVARRTATLSGKSAIVLADNATAFPLRVDAASLDRQLRRLRTVARFPRSLRDALQRFDRAAAERAVNGGPFETWLLSPRTLVELDERRAALLTLIEARVAERGAGAVLSL